MAYLRGFRPVISAGRTATVVSSFTKRAAICVALFVLSASYPVTAVFQFVPAAQAKMRQDKLTIEPAGGGAGHTFDIQVAATAQEKALGLMFRTRLDDAEGMLFPYPLRGLSRCGCATHTSRSICCSSGRTERSLASRSAPSHCRIASSSRVLRCRRYSRLRAARASRLGIKPGDRVRYPLFAGDRGALKRVARRSGCRLALTWDCESGT